MTFADRTGRAADLLRAVDWDHHPLGRPSGWPASLKTAVGFILASPESMYLSWGKCQTFFFNDAYIPILGPRVDRAMGAHFPELWADAWPSVSLMVDRALAGEPSLVEDMPIPMARHGEPEDTWWSFSFSPWLDEEGDVTGLFCLTNETTRLVLDKRAQQDAEARNRQILDSATDYAIVATDLDGLISRWNVGAERMLGWTEREMLGQPVDRFFTVEDVQANRPAIEMKEALETGSGRDERWHQRKNGERFWANGEMTVLRDDVRIPTGFVKVLRDRTEERLADERLRELNATLEERVLHEVAARMKTEEALRQSQKVEAIGQLTGGVAHDFNNLLTVIKGSTDLLRRPDLADEKRKRYIDAISDTADRATKLTGQLLAFARRQSLRPEIFDVGRNVDALGDMLESLTGSQVEVVITPCDEPCFVDADPSQFDTALVNMAVNARDAMEGRGRISIVLRSVKEIPPVRGHGVVPGEFVRISMSDTGNGIDPDKLPQIFEPFFTTKAVGRGTGLGLSQVFGFAKQSGGDILVSSVVGEGTTFSLYLPAVEAPVDVPVVNADDQEHTSGACVLVVEDNHAVGEFALQALRELGHHTVLAIDAERALAELEKNANRFDVVFSDVVMPGMSGIELGREIRRLYPNLPVILTSGYSTVLAENGGHGFDLVHKPYSIEALSRALKKGVHRRSASKRALTSG